MKIPMDGAVVKALYGLRSRVARPQDFPGVRSRGEMEGRGLDGDGDVWEC